MWVGRQEVNPQVKKTQAPNLLTDGSDHATRPKDIILVKGWPITSNWCAPQVPMCRLWFYNAVNPSLRKADHLSLATGDMVCG